MEDGLHFPKFSTLILCLGKQLEEGTNKDHSKDEKGKRKGGPFSATLIDDRTSVYKTAPINIYHGRPFHSSIALYLAQDKTFFVLVFLGLGPNNNVYKQLNIWLSNVTCSGKSHSTFPSKLFVFFHPVCCISQSKKIVYFTGLINVANMKISWYEGGKKLFIL